MLSDELSGIPYNKTAHRGQLLPKLRDRTEGAVERKHQNISAILIEAGLPAIDGYKPLFNYQVALRDEVLATVSRKTDVLRLIRRLEVAIPPTTKFGGLDPLAVTVPAPERRDLQMRREPETDWRESVRKYDFEVRDERLRRVGRAGEEFVVEYEKARLAAIGRHDLADRVEWVTDTLGDGAGFDVLSYDDRDQELYVDARDLRRSAPPDPTNFDKYQPFLISRNEVSFSARHAERYSLYRVFHFALAPKLFRLNGSVEKAVQLSPLVFEGKL
jgi:hypothetical protein